ncbi:hypothetical protein E2C01_081613 [Portunus trituberculatus]|uniref:Uncharacterized protein n=1 Tax=Portunus trituberculatus TaxID=210409 RepID=A0A5B7IZB6_PORTR|nr:hypothetical protein [Portunus trituberculatus]
MPGCCRAHQHHHRDAFTTATTITTAFTTVTTTTNTIAITLPIPSTTFIYHRYLHYRSITSTATPPPLALLTSPLL